MRASLESAVIREARPPGMGAEVEGLFSRALAAPHGLVLFAGPPGSGRRSTIDEALDLRADALTADIDDRIAADRAVQAALAGRLVLAKVQAENAVGAIAGLRALKVEPFLIASTLRAVLAQRRLRRLCPHCRRPVQAAAGLSARLGFDPGAIVYRAEGCDACGGEGTLGCIFLFEAVEIDIAMRRLIGSGGDSPILAGQAYRDRPDLGGAARALVRKGEISGEDAVRLGRTQSQ